VLSYGLCHLRCIKLRNFVGGQRQGLAGSGGGFDCYSLLPYSVSLHADRISPRKPRISNDVYTYPFFLFPVTLV
jgi:hypothetical protein